jgi:hypothetical protein
MSSPVTTTYCGHQITIEPYEWGYLAQIVEPGSGRRFIAARPTAMRVLDDAFDAIDDSLGPPRMFSAARTPEKR